MPESVTDRPTKSHEFLYLLTKSHKYYYDIEAVREPYTEPLNRWGGPKLKKETLKHSKYLGMQSIGLSSALREGRGMRPNPAGRNKRTVWTIPTVPFPEAHFAVFPERLIEPCILAGTSEKGCCVECGASRERVLEKKEYGRWDHGQGSNQDPSKVHKMRSDVMGKNFDDKYEAPKTVGWKAGCDCRVASKPCIVLDPFFGSGTTGEVAHKFGRNFTVIELGESYLKDIAVPRMEKATQQRKLF